jgi:hypothetical protein
MSDDNNNGTIQSPTLHESYGSYSADVGHVRSRSGSYVTATTSATRLPLTSSAVVIAGTATDDDLRSGRVRVAVNNPHNQNPHSTPSRHYNSNSNNSVDINHQRLHSLPSTVITDGSYDDTDMNINDIELMPLTRHNHEHASDNDSNDGIYHSNRHIQHHYMNSNDYNDNDNDTYDMIDRDPPSYQLMCRCVLLSSFMSFICSICSYCYNPSWRWYHIIIACIALLLIIISYAIVISLRGSFVY